MARPYSNDLRERVVARVVAGDRVRAVAATFGVSVASVVKWSQRLRRTGSVVPDKMGFRRPKLLAPHRDWLLARMNDGRRFTLRGLQAELAERGVTVDYRTVWNFVHAEQMSFKKNRAARRAGSS
jgi:transposase